MGMLPQGTLRTPDVTVCYQFQPFHEVGGDFLDFFTLTDGVIGIYLGDVRGKGLPAALYAALAVGTLRGVHKTGAAADGLEHSQPESDVARRVAALRCGPVWVFRPAHGNFANRQRGNGGPADSFSARLP